MVVISDTILGDKAENFLSCLFENKLPCNCETLQRGKMWAVSETRERFQCGLSRKQKYWICRCIYTEIDFITIQECLGDIFVLIESKQDQTLSTTSEQWPDEILMQEAQLNCHSISSLKKLRYLMCIALRGYMCGNLLCSIGINKVIHQ